MLELEKKINDIMNRLNQIWIDALKEGQKGDGVDLSTVFSGYSQLVQEKDTAFLEAEVRSGKKKGFMRK